jgi:uroporphyrinogen decarboxylase
MNSKQRVLTALRRTGAPDRVPLQFDFSRKLLEDFSARLNIPLRYSMSYYEDLRYRISGNEIRTALGSDAVVVGAGLPAGYTPQMTEDGAMINEFGMKMRQGALYMEVIEEPLKDVTSEDAVRRFPFPDPLAAGRFDDAQQTIARYQNDYCIIGDLELSMFEMAWHMVGLEKFLLDMASDEPYVSLLFDRVLEFTIGVGKKLVELGVDIVWTGDDIGSQNAMMISPRMWRSIFKPRQAELIRELKAINPKVLVAYHSDGVVAPVLDDLIEIGVDVFNPVQPNVPGHDARELKAKFGDRIAFWGGIDQQQLLPYGTPEEIEKDVADKIQALGQGGGYLCAPAHILQADVSMENVEVFIAAVKKHGVYPL